MLRGFQMEKKNKTITITLLGGVNEVGGNVVLLEDFSYGVKLFIDFGIKIKKYYNKYEYGRRKSRVIIINSRITNHDKMELFKKEFPEIYEILTSEQIKEFLDGDHENR